MKTKFLFFVLLFCALLIGNNSEAQQMKHSSKTIDLVGDSNPGLKAGMENSQNPSVETIGASWTTLATSPNAVSRSFCVYAKPGGVEYVYQFGGGNTSAQLRSIARYDIAANTWSVLGQTLNLDVSAGAAINDGDSVIYVFGGSGIVTVTLGSTQKINLITGVVTTLAAMPVAITDAAVVKYHDSLIYVIGGGAGTFGASTVTNVQVYNKKQNTYAAATPYPLAVAMMGYGIDGNKIICAGGWNGTAAISNSYKGVIDPTNHLLITWSAIPNHPISTLGITRTASYFVQKGANKGIMMTGGAIGGSTLTNKTYLFNTVCESWDSTVVNSLARSNFKAAGRGDSVAWVVAGFTTVGVGTTERINFSSISCGQLTNDVACTAIISPPLGIALPSPAFNPVSTVKNVGTATQTFNVTMTVTPGGYTSTKTVTGLVSLASQNVTFDPYTPVVGNYTVKVFTQLATDQDHANDTCTQSLTVVQPNYGGGGPTSCGTYFANSTSGADQSPSKPKYCRVDTTGSISLVVNSTASIPVSVGDLDDGYWAFSGLGGTRKFKMCGVTYDSVFIGTNGIISFTAYTPGGGNWNPPAAGLPGPGPGGPVRPALYPAWNDLNWGNVSQPINRLSYLVDNTKKKFIVTYDRAPLFGGIADEFQTFQVCIDFQADTAGAPNSNYVFSYDSSFNTINLPFLVGSQDPTGANWMQYTFINSSGIVITPGPLFDGLKPGLAVTFGPDNTKLYGCCKILSLDAKIEGYWNSGVYTPDTISVEIRSAITPYNIIETATGKQDANGNIVLQYGFVDNDIFYYIVVKHRNALETWSKAGGEKWLSSTLNYDFTTSNTKAYGNNLTLKDGEWTIYSGDVTQDGTVDITDVGIIENDAYNFVSGYVVTDLNCDGVVDLVDQAIADNNAYNFVTLIRP